MNTYILIGLLLAAVPLAATSQVTFTKITTGAIVNDGGNSFGCAWGDYDGDGYPDLLVTNGGPDSDQRNFLYHNNGNGTFTKITTGAIATDVTGQWRGCAWVDFDNDGNLDLVAMNGEENDVQNVLYRNNGDGTFTRMPTSTLGGVVPTGGGNSFSPAWADVDNDGFLDLFVARIGLDWFFHNQGNGTFAKVNNGLGEIGQTQTNFGAVWGDINNDGRPALFVPNSGTSTNRLYVNLGGDSFARLTSGAIAADVTQSFSAAWGDYDNDGNLDLFVPNSVAGESNFLYRNNGDGTFTRMTSAVVGSIASDSAGFDECVWGDYDNDGYLDLYLTATPGIGGNSGGNALYHNNGDGSFTRIQAGSPVEDSADSVGCAWVDYDNDGFLDLFVANGGVVASENNALYHNDGNSNAWLKVKCVGTVSNRSGVGAKVRVKATIGGKTFWQMREINTGSGMTQGTLEAHFGLGDATNATLVRVEWPSGTVQEFQNVPAKQIWTVNEPSRLSVESNGDGLGFSLWGGRGRQYQIESSTDLALWKLAGTVTITNLNGKAQIGDTNSSAASRLFYRAVSR